MARTKTQLKSAIDVWTGMTITDLKELKKVNWKKSSMLKATTLIKLEDITHKTHNLIGSSLKIMKDALIVIYKAELVKKTGLSKIDQVFYSRYGQKHKYKGIQFVEKEQPQVIYSIDTPYYKTIPFDECIKWFKEKKFVLKK